MRKVKFFIAIDDVTMEALEKVLLLIDICERVSDANQADMVISDSFSKAGQYFSTDKQFVVVPKEKPDVKKIPDNVKVFYPFTLGDLYSLYSLIYDIYKTIEKRTEEEIEFEEGVKLKPDAKKILVIEDNSQHRRSASKLLAGNILSIVNGCDEAMTFFALAEGQIDIVMSDLYLPMSSKMLSEKAFEIGKEVPYGLLLALEAARKGAKYVAIVTYLGHHDDPFSAAFDYFSQYTYQIFGAKVKFMHAPMKKMGDMYVKDWEEALKKLLS